tara:strand:+ start:1868 stop:2098 length:231 start_codon:yes stop_codon:yes gene_type:complete
MKQSADITTYVKKFLKKLIKNPNKNVNPESFMKYYNIKIKAVYDVSILTKKELLEIYKDIDDPAYSDETMIIVRLK